MVESAALEKQCSSNGTAGSNPAPSANKKCLKAFFYSQKKETINKKSNYGFKNPIQAISILLGGPTLKLSVILKVIGHI